MIMRKTLIGLTFIAALLPSVAGAQTTPFPQTLPANTVVGRLGIGPGPSQAIPLATLAESLNMVTSPTSSTDNAIVRFDGTTGKVVQNSTAILSDAGLLTTVAGFIATGPTGSQGSPIDLFTSPP